MATVNDLVLVHIDNKPGFYARIEDIVPDVKPGWWQVRLLVLTVPIQVFTWILDESQVSGAPYTMGGTPVRLEKVVAPAAPDKETSPARPSPAVVGKSPKKGGGAKVVSLAERKKN
ncbi:hypothetical protein [Geobacter sp. AOG1]|uniref:hypothetical protein n=1 Tax=Geobacter sp. AOG1 TaxID=1566346 RepID=UPI001CC4D168|nr:hypothetical protein [Geobacter sp. AOG1]GFE57525.1 hypothetical protein AOG1_14050 [Geobacter sp. AOG1]